MLHYLWVKSPQTWSWKDLQVKIGEFCSTSDCVGFVWSRNGAKQGAELLTSEDSCKTSYWSDDENSKFQSMERYCGKGISHQVSKSKESLRWEESGRVFSVAGTRSSHPRGDSCSFSHDTKVPGTSGKGQKRQGRSSSPASHSKAKQTDGEEQKSSQGSGSKQENSLNKSEIPCRFKFSKNPSCKFWHPPVCLNCKSEKGCVHGDKCHFRHVEAEGKPNKRSNKGGSKGSVAMSKESGQLGCVSEDFCSRKICSTWTGKKGSIARDHPKVVASWALSLRTKITWGDLSPRKMRPQSSVGFVEKLFQAQEFRQNYVLYSNWKKGCRHLLQRDQRSANLLLIQEHQCTWWAKKILAQERWTQLKGPEPLQKCWLQTERCKPTRRHMCSFMISISSWHCNYSMKRLQSYRWESFAKTTDTPMSGSAVKKPRLTKDGKTIICKTDNFVLLVVPGLSTNPASSSSSASLHRTSWKKEAERATRSFKFIFKFSIRAKWRTCNDTGAIPRNSKNQIKRGVAGRLRKIRWQIFLTG